MKRYAGELVETVDVPKVIVAEDVALMSKEPEEAAFLLDVVASSLKMPLDVYLAVKTQIANEFVSVFFELVKSSRYVEGVIVLTMRRSAILEGVGFSSTGYTHGNYRFDYEWSRR